MGEIMNHETIVMRELKRNRKGITQLDMIRYGILRLGARIWDLRHKGIEINTIPEESTNQYGHKVRFARYRLVR